MKYVVAFKNKKRKKQSKRGVQSSISSSISFRDLNVAFPPRPLVSSSRDTRGQPAGALIWFLLHCVWMFGQKKNFKSQTMSRAVRQGNVRYSAVTVHHVGVRWSWLVTPEPASTARVYHVREITYWRVATPPRGSEFRYAVLQRSFFPWSKMYLHAGGEAGRWHLRRRGSTNFNLEHQITCPPKYYIWHNN
jgi:hypothetical protein